MKPPKDDLYYEIQSLRVGDIILFNDNPRLIRKISPYTSERSPMKGINFFYYFAIKKPSWTTRPYTVYTYYDLRQMYGGIVKRHVPLVRKGNKMEALVQYHIDNFEGCVNDYLEAMKQRAPKMYIEAKDMAGTIL